jgi:hypothetical protein
MIVALLHNGANLILEAWSADNHKVASFTSIRVIGAPPERTMKDMRTLEKSSFCSHSRSCGTDLSRKNLAFSATPDIFVRINSPPVSKGKGNVEIGLVGGRCAWQTRQDFLYRWSLSGKF